MNTPDMSRKAADITDPRELYARIGVPGLADSPRRA